jgi:tripartite-type tricarboxylate transporter receptor subunit TctC
MKRNAFLACLLMFVASAFAQYPDRPIRLVIPFPAGSSTDTIARIITEVVSKAMGQPVVIDNKPGADAMIAAMDVVKARPDGYTLLIATGSLAAVPAMRRSAPYDPLADFTPITDIGRYTLFLFVNADVPAQSLPDLIAYAKANPDKLNYATSSVSNIVATAQMNTMAGVQMVAVPYKSAPAAMVDLVSGRVHVMWDPPTAGIAHVREGKLRALATAHSVRSALLPDVPTMAELGMPKFVGPAFMGLVGPAKMPPEVVNRLNKEFMAAMKQPEVIAALEKQAFALNPSTPAQFGEFMKAQVETHTRLLRAAGIQPQ